MALQKTIFCHTHQSLWFHSTRMRYMYRCQQQITDNRHECNALKPALKRMRPRIHCARYVLHQEAQGKTIGNDRIFIIVTKEKRCRDEC